MRYKLHIFTWTWIWKLWDNFDFSESADWSQARNVPWAAAAEAGGHNEAQVGNNKSCDVRAESSAELMMKYEHNIMIFLNRDRVLE